MRVAKRLPSFLVVTAVAAAATTLLLAPIARRHLAWQAGAAGTGPFGCVYMALFASNYPQCDDYERALSDAAASRTDPASQSAVLISGFQTKEMLLGADRIASRFPDSPVALATAVKALAHRTGSDRPESGFGTDARTRAHRAPETSTDAAALRRLLHLSRRGQALDPGNALFPAARIGALFALNRDEEALAALHEAALCRQYRDHGDATTQALWALQDDVVGIRTGIARCSRSPRFESLSFTTPARVAASLAWKAERSGAVEEGLRIRLDLLQLGGLVRAEASRLSGAWEGMRMALVSGIWAGGAQQDFDGSAEDFMNQQMGRFAELLRGRGDSLNAACVQRERASCRKAALIPRWWLDSRMERIWVVGTACSVGALAVLAALWALLVAGVSRAAMHLFGRSADRPLPLSLAIALSGGSAAGASLCAAPETYWQSMDHPVALLLLLPPLVVLAAARLMRWRRVETVALLAIVAVLAGAVSLVVAAVFTSYAEISPVWWGTGPAVLQIVSVILVSSLFGLALLAGAARKTPVRRLFGSLLPRVGVCLAAAMVIVWACAMGLASRWDAELAQSAAGSVPHEGRFSARLAGAEWPGPPQPVHSTVPIDK